MGGSKKWIEAGYELLAREGPDGVQVEKLARQLDLNKSGFYHYFGDREIYFYELMEYHLEVMEQFFIEVLSLRCFDPDYLKLLVKYKTSVFVQKQIHTNDSVRVFNEGFKKVRIKNEKRVIRLWADYLGLIDNFPLSRELWHMIRDVFFFRITPEKMNLEFIRSVTEEVRNVVEKLHHTSDINKTREVRRSLVNHLN
jgi:AcrR family transcriptional regulator